MQVILTEAEYELLVSKSELDEALADLDIARIALLKQITGEDFEEMEYRDCKDHFSGYCDKCPFGGLLSQDKEGICRNEKKELKKK